MRTTVTLDPETRALVERRMRERGISFKRALNDAIRAGLGRQAATRRIATPTHRMGPPAVPLTKAVTLAASLDDEDIVRELELGR